MTSPISKSQKAGRQGGFTIIELLVVMGVMGLMIGLIVIHGPMHSRTLDIHGTAEEVSGGLREARAQAIAANHSTKMTLDLVDRTWQVNEETVNRFPANIDIKVTLARDEAKNARQAGIAFEPDGSSTGGRIELSSGSKKIDIGVEWLTGRVSIVDMQ